MKFKTYSGEYLTDCIISRKIDGVRAHSLNGGIVSRSGKPLYNIPTIYDVCEVFINNWETTISRVRTRDGELISKENLYQLNPVDERLFIGNFESVDSSMVNSLMLEVLKDGYEGLIIQSQDTFYKVKPVISFDTKVIGIIPGKGKHQNKIGALVTEFGNVGTGFTDEERTHEYLGQIIEVECMGLTPSGKFRHPRFKRIRFDK